MCEAVCSRPNLTAMCAGFTYYPSHNGTDSQCCFRSDTSNKPVDPTSDVECYEKDRGGGEECAGEPLGVMVTGKLPGGGSPFFPPLLFLILWRPFLGHSSPMCRLSQATCDVPFLVHVLAGGLIWAYNPHHLLLRPIWGASGPSVSYAFPAANPTIRLMTHQCRTAPCMTACVWRHP